MNEQFKNEMMRRLERHERRKGHGRVFAGLFLLIIGTLWLLKTTEIVAFPSWFFTWPMLIIAAGLFSGIKHKFRTPLWAILLMIGIAGLVGKIYPELGLERYVWPVIIIAIGLMFILRPRRRRWKYRDCAPGFDQDKSSAQVPSDGRDFVEVTAVFGGVKKNILTKNFKGGDIVSFMGGSEIDLTQADFTGRVVIDTTNIFGGTKLIVPPTWDVQSDITAIFGGVDDKRQVSGVQPDPDKLLVLDGTCMFGGIEIRSF